MAYNSRVSNMLRISGGDYVDEDTGEIHHPNGGGNFNRDRVARRDAHFNSLSTGVSKITNKMAKFKMPPVNIGAIINIAIVGGIALVAYKIYTKFFGGSSSAIENAVETAKNDLVKTFVPNAKATSNQLTATASSLSNKGLNVSDMHMSLANTFHDILNSTFCDTAKMVKIIKAEQIQTFRLVSVAYGTRDLTIYARAITHIFGSFSRTAFAADGTELVGTLKFHLQTCLSSDEQSQISTYLAVI